eukprot:1504291-Rhodomonas_salina.1
MTKEPRMLNDQHCHLDSDDGYSMMPSGVDDIRGLIAACAHWLRGAVQDVMTVLTFDDDGVCIDRQG